MSSDLTRVRRWSSVLAVLCVISIVVIALAVILGAAFASLPVELATTAGVAPDALSRPHLIAIALVGALPALAAIWTLAQAQALFRHYAAGDVLSSESARRLSRIGSGLLAIAALGVIVRPIQTVLASLGNPPGERVLALTLQGPDFGLVLAGGLMTVIGWVMAEAARIAEDNRGFV